MTRVDGRAFAPVLAVWLAAAMPQTVVAAAGFDLDGAWKLVHSGRYDEAISAAREALQGDVTELEWRVLIVRAHVATGRLREATDEVDVLLDRYGHSLRAQWIAHELAQEKGDAVGAKTPLTRIGDLARGKTFTDAVDLVAAGLAALRLGGDPKTILASHFEVAAKKDPRWRETYLAAGGLALDKHDDALAAEWLSPLYLSG